MHDDLFAGGDPTFAGWAITGAYVLGVIVCLAAGLKERRGGNVESFPSFWFGLGGGLLLFGANKQLDLHNVMTSLVRDMARSGGWYHHRRLVQGVFVTAIALGAGAAGMVFVWFMGRRALRYPLACAGIGLLGVFVVLRAASFHHGLSAFQSDSPLRDGWVTLAMEGAGIGLVGADAVRTLLPYNRSTEHETHTDTPGPAGSGEHSHHARGGRGV